MTREYIKNKIQLCGQSDNGKFTHTFRILGGRPSEGASSVCYEAYYEGSSRGVLKEFYPEEISFKPRNDENHQLVCSDEFAQDIEDFRKKREAYIAPYIELQKMKRDEKYHELATFIPPFEIYRGLSENSTVYIWTPMPKFLTFDEFCADVHEHPKHGAAYKFFQAIDAVRYLARCVSELQAGGLVHRDIKPGNIGFFRRGDEIQPQTLSMFDIDSVCFIGSTSDEIPYSKGYTEPEYSYTGYQPNYQTDIYSIGAVLFHALIVNDEVRANEFLYRDKYYSRLEEFVSTSELIRNAEADYNVKSKLIEILRNCLCERNRRYRDPQTGNTLGCEKLIEDLDTLFNDYTKGRTLEEERKNYMIDLDMNSALVLQYHLYRYPLYRFIGSQKNINVMLLGFGRYSDKFLDACLQAGQMMGKVLNVKVILESFADRDEYLRNRPELARFFNVDGSLAPKPDDSYDVYGNITFIERPEITQIFGDTPDINKLREILAMQANTAYMFIDLNNDEQNLTAAHSLAAEVGKNCCVNFVHTGKPDNDNFNGIIPVYVNADVSQFPEFREIEKMAFNVHLSWLSDMNTDRVEERKNFLNPYNHTGSISNVLNVKYKLASLNPDYDNLSFDEAAKRFNEFLNSKEPEDRRKYNELICFEHRRWTTEKLCDGCRVKLPKECESDSDTKTRESEGRRKVTHHVCLVRSRADQLLHDEWDNDMRKWNDPTPAELTQLDELDRMSVELHRVFLAQAREAMREKVLDENTISRICNLIERDPQVLSAFNDLCICMKDLMMSFNDTQVGSARRKVSHYSRLNKAFEKSLTSEKISPEKKEEAEKESKILEENFRPILDSMRFRDYKHSDTDLIDSIPFILTYSDNITLVIPYIDDVSDKTKCFSNAASAIVINPSRIIYLSYLDDDEDVTKLMNSINRAGAYITGRNLCSRIEFIITRNSNLTLSENITDTINNAFAGANVKILDELETWSAYDAAEIFTTQLETERANSGADSVLAIEKNDSLLSGILEGSGLYKSFAHYKFTSKTMAFTNISGCELFRYIHKPQSIMRSDMFAVKKGLAPEFFRDYQALWKEYRAHKGIWKMLCDGLRDYEDSRKRIAEFTIIPANHKKPHTETLKYILPIVCRSSVELIFSILKKNSVIEDVSLIRNYTTNSFELVIYDRCGYSDKYSELFGNPYRLMSLDAVNVNDDGSKTVEVEFDNLIAVNASIPGFKTDRYNSVIELMKFFRNMGFVYNLAMDKKNGVMSFTYAAHDIKQLLTTSGRILEVYTYHKARELGYFDDVISSLEVRWGHNANINNEFDCILTKGFRTLFVECKARNILDQDMFHKISHLSNQLGINFTPVIIADTEAEEGRAAVINHNMRDLGREAGIITVWKSAEIADIGEVLMKIMNGTYTPQY